MRMRLGMAALVLAVGSAAPVAAQVQPPEGPPPTWTPPDLPPICVEHPSLPECVSHLPTPLGGQPPPSASPPADLPPLCEAHPSLPECERTHGPGPVIVPATAPPASASGVAGAGGVLPRTG